MGGVVKAVTSLLGGGSAPKADVSDATGKIADAESKSAKARSALLETGASGAPLQPGQVQSRDTLFGN